MTKSEFKDGFMGRTRALTDDLRGIETWPRLAGVFVYLACNVAGAFWVVAHPIGDRWVSAWVLADLAIGLPALIRFGRTRRQILKRGRCEQPHCPQCGAGLDDANLRPVVIATNHCGRCGSELWKTPAVRPPPGLPSKAEFLDRWSVAKRQLGALSMIQFGWLLSSVALVFMGAVWQKYLIHFSVIGFGSFIGSAVWPMRRAERILQQNRLHCPGCSQALAPNSSQTKLPSSMLGRIALATGACGRCGAQVYRPSAEEVSSPVCLPRRNDFSPRVKVFHRKVTVLSVIWCAGIFVALAMPRLLIEGGFIVDSPAIELRVKGLQYLSCLAFMGVCVVYLKWRSERLAKENQLLCPNCAKLVASETVIATGKCWNCECRIYTRES